MYVLKNNESLLEEYACVVVEEFDFNSVYHSIYGLSLTDDLRDATKFSSAFDAWEMYEVLELKGWDVVEVSGL